MREQITERLKTLQVEAEAGQKLLADLDARRAALTTTLLRIEGAIQVLKQARGKAHGLQDDTLVAKIADLIEWQEALAAA